MKTRKSLRKGTYDFLRSDQNRLCEEESFRIPPHVSRREQKSDRSNIELTTKERTYIFIADIRQRRGQNGEKGGKTGRVGEKRMHERNKSSGGRN